MAISLAGEWAVTLEENSDYGPDCRAVKLSGKISLPGSLQQYGFGYPVEKKTPWVSSLYNPFWYERDEYTYAQESGIKVPFLAQPATHYLGRAFYSKKIVLDKDMQDCVLFLEVTRWKTSVFVDGKECGQETSLCTPHVHRLGDLSAGEHTIAIEVDNRMIYPYRPDGHGVSDALGATWNGIVGKMVLLSGREWNDLEEKKKEYATKHARKMGVSNGKFLSDGQVVYFRGTHFGGDYPITGYPNTADEWWNDLMNTVKSFGINFIRFHSYCPPEAAFAAADRADIFLQPECGMWNYFEDETEMYEILKSETVRILRAFGHHPSFVLFSPSNEPGGKWYSILREWVMYARETDRSLGYEGRRLYTAQSGWFYDTAPSETTGTDYLYFHRSAYGSLPGGTIRNSEGWKGRNYDSSLENSKLPVICHELGQWCSYPDYGVIGKFAGVLQPGNYEIFRESARNSGVLENNKEFVFCSGRNQVRLYKEDIEANFRTRHLYGFELLDLHDYLGQGTANVGILDPFWDNKGYVTPDEFQEFCGDTVICTELSSYVWKNTDIVTIPVLVCHYGARTIQNAVLEWKLTDAMSGLLLDAGNEPCEKIPAGENTKVCTLRIELSFLSRNTLCRLEVSIGEVRNHWMLHVFASAMKDVLTEEESFLYTRDWSEVKKALNAGKTVVFSPYLSDLDYDCPAVSMKNVFWNAQMNPSWCRSLGVICDGDHPVFDRFPTFADGGWQWEEILKYSRAFCMDDMPKQLQPIVRVIDDWNRNLPLCLLAEAKVGKGHLILSGICLDTTPDSLPQQNAFRQAVFRYARNCVHKTNPEVPYEAVEKHLFPMLFTQKLIQRVTDQNGVVFPHDNLADPNPNLTFRYEQNQYPITLEIRLSEYVAIKGLYLLPVQKDRMFEGCIREFCIEGVVETSSSESALEEKEVSWKTLSKGIMKNNLFGQKIYFDEVITTDCIRLIVLSGYGEDIRPVWHVKNGGWVYEKEQTKAVLQLAGFHLITDCQCTGEDSLFWMEGYKSISKDVEN